MPRKALTRARSARDNATSKVVSTQTAKDKELARILDERPDKPVLIRVRTWFLEKIEENKESIWADLDDVIKGRFSSATKDMDVLMHQLRQIPVENKDERLQILQAVARIADGISRAQQSRERILSKLLDKLLIDTRESDPDQRDGGALFKGANISIAVGGGIKRGTAIDVEASPP